MQSKKYLNNALLMISLPFLSGLVACSSATDTDLIKAENNKAVRRYDISQAMASNGKVIAVGTQSGAVIVSADQGRQWQRIELGNTSLIDMAVCPDGSFVAIDHYHKVWSSQANAQVWKASALAEPQAPIAITCDFQGNWSVVGSRSTIAKSVDKGNSWKVFSFDKDTQFTTIQYLNQKDALVTGEFGMVVVTSDAGETWKQIAKMPNDFYPYAALFLTRNEGWVSGIAGQILHTTDGGNSWVRQNNRTQVPIYRLFLAEGVPFGVGAEGVITQYVSGEWRNFRYPDAIPVFLGGGASIPGQKSLIAGGPAGLLRVIGTNNQ